MRRDDASERQVQAADSAASIWLSANAGSGKTKVLTDRVARLLLGGTEPQRILCLTYTTAAASEMQNRLFRRLGEWAMLPEPRLREALARYGGEEFVVLLPETSVDDGQQILTRLQRTMSAEFFTHEDKKVFITFSAGVTLYRAEEPIEAALERADIALYEAKRTGKNRTCTA